MGEYRVLDKDLDRLNNAEGAGRAAARPLRRLGMIIGLASLAVLAMALLGIGLPVEAPLVAGFAVALYLALNIGANDVANSVGAAVGGRVLPVGLALAAVATAQLAGALLASEAVTATIATEIIAIGELGPDAHPGQIMAASLIGAALWITLANWARAPVSTTHSIVGALAGAGLAGMGASSINWPVVGSIALSWIAAPVISAVLAAGVLALLRWRVRFADDLLAAARFWLPLLIGLTGTIFGGYLLTLAEGPSIGRLGLFACAGFGLMAACLSRWQLERQITTHLDSGEPIQKLSLKNLLTVPLIVAALLSGFAHGANDVANVAGPLSVLMHSAQPGVLPMWAVALAGLAVAAGSLIFGRRLVRMVGSSITRLNATRAFCAALASAATVLACSALGLPVSTTHCAVGGIFGVGFYREWEDRLRRKSRKILPVEEAMRRRLVRRSHVWTTLAAWAVTMPGAALMAAAGYGLLSLAH
ncbi:inorganic phosphate transporter [Paracoccus sediminicola]|uniref:inorganic phosphate transporter n=1 Tax=Paracoccus sediminicola TaxID=3017783 RepID=UPI0022EFE264|nr:inorganic phosphate transporter [Paracoccus sediminicola]WBU56746.1 inorganic phosphate transporter [Paracoccus sediminicola]